MTDPVLHEVFEQWPAWQTVVETLLPVGTDAREVEPKQVADALGDMNGASLRRLVHLLVGHAHAETLGEATTLLGEMWALALVGRRPRFGVELGLSTSDFEASK